MKRFKKIYLEISNICNLQCSFCPEVERSKFRIDEQVLRGRLRQVKALTERVCFHVMGEPLAHPGFAGLIKVAEEMEVPLEITTNGTLLNEILIEALLNPTVVQVNFSLQSFIDNFPKSTPETYLNKIFNFCRIAFERRPDLYINLRLWNLKKNEASVVNDFLISRIEREFSSLINRTVDPGFRKSKRVVNRLYLHFDSRFEWPHIDQEAKSYKGSCYGLRNHVAVLAGGEVVPCCLDKEASMNLGNIDVKPFAQIIDNSRAKRIREGFEIGELREELCQKCDYAQRFKA